jgi:hypothetical protein
MKLLTIVFLALTSLIGLLPNTAEVSAFEVSAFESESLAKCAMPSFEASYRDSAAIFTGKVLSERKEGDEKIFTIRVEKYWKGKKSKTVEVHYYETMRYQAWLKVGEKYLVYARSNDQGTLSDGRCSLTKNYSEAKADLKKLGKGKIVK